MAADPTTERIIALTQPALQLANSVTRLIIIANRLSDFTIIAELTLLRNHARNFADTIQAFIKDLEPQQTQLARDHLPE